VSDPKAVVEGDVAAESDLDRLRIRAVQDRLREKAARERDRESRELAKEAERLQDEIDGRAEKAAETTAKSAGKGA
jgi:hypothetical protein